MKIAMAREGTQFTGDGISLSWPFGGTREVVEVEQLTGRIRERVGGQSIVILDDAVEATEYVAPAARGNLLLDGEEARAHRAKPPKPVTWAKRNARVEAQTTQGPDGLEIIQSVKVSEPAEPKPRPRKSAPAGA